MIPCRVDVGHPLDTHVKKSAPDLVFLGIIHFYMRRQKSSLMGSWYGLTSGKAIFGKTYIRELFKDVNAEGKLPR